jgi:hypothetical protein
MKEPQMNRRSCAETQPMAQEIVRGAGSFWARASALVFGSLGLWGGLLGCAVEGANADCPPMPITSDPFDPELAAWREQAEAKGCVTPRGESISENGSEPEN